VSAVETMVAMIAAARQFEHADEAAADRREQDEQGQQLRSLS
jgi:flagellar basal body rod protein FlgF